MLRQFLFIVLLCLCRTVSAQLQIDPVFQHIGPEKLGVKEAGGMIWDKKGGAWVISNEGLIYFNGYSSLKFPHKKNDKTSPLSNSIQSFFLDSQSQLWIAYRDVSGFSKMDPQSGICKHFLPDSTGKNKNAVSASLIAGFREDHSGNMWIAHWGSGFARFDPKKELFRYFPVSVSKKFHPDSVPNGFIKAFTETENGKFLMGFFQEEDSLALPCWFDSKTEKFSQFPLREYLGKLSADEAKSITNALTIVHFIYTNGGKKIWFGTYSCLIRLDLKEKTIRRISGRKIEENKNNYENARVYLFDEKGNMWIGTPNAGIMVVDTLTEETGYVLSNPRMHSSLADNRVTSLKKDSDGNIWIGTGTGGYSIYTPLIQQFNIFPWAEMDLEYSNRSRQRVPVNQMLIQNKGLVYISNEKGISVFNVDKNKIEEQISPLGKMPENTDPANGSRIDNFKVLKDGKILMISWQKPAMYDLVSKKFTRIKTPWGEMKPNQTSNILFRHRKYEDSLLVTYGNKEKAAAYLYEKNKNSFTEFYEFKGPRPSESYSYVLKNGKWLLSSSERTFLVFDPRTKQNDVYNAAQKGKFYFPDSTINTCYVDPDENVFFCTQNGLYRFDVESGKCEHLNAKLGIGKEPVNAMIKDKYGSYWLALDKEIAKWNPAENNNLLRFGEQEGLRASTFFGSIAQMDEKGRIYIVSINGITVFDPLLIRLPESTPKLLLSSLVINDDTLNMNKAEVFASAHNTLTWNQNLLTFEIKCTQLYAPRPHHFYYRLIGLDSAWIDNGISNLIRFPGLKHGNYTLEVKIINAYRVQSDVLSVSFEIARPFWLSWWFYVLLACALFVIVVYVIRKREKILKKRQEELEEKIQERTAEVVAKAEEIKLQKDIIEEQNKAVLDSIRYAKRIQNALIASEKYIERNLKKLNGGF